ncbi:MAG: hypothetical protein ACTSX8_03225 [Alphaproteobacteria bacterium]
MATQQTPRTMDEQIDALKARVLVSSLKRHKGCVRQVALELGLHRGGIYKTLDRLGIDVDNYRPE